MKRKLWMFVKVALFTAVMLLCFRMILAGAAAFMNWAVIHYDTYKRVISCLGWIVLAAMFATVGYAFFKIMEENK